MKPWTLTTTSDINFAKYDKTILSVSHQTVARGGT